MPDSTGKIEKVVVIVLPTKHDARKDLAMRNLDLTDEAIQKSRLEKLRNNVKEWLKFSRLGK